MSAGSDSSSSSSEEDEDEDEEREPELEPLLLLLLLLLLLEDFPRPRRLARPRFLVLSFCAAALRFLRVLDRRLLSDFGISFYGGRLLICLLAGLKK